MKTIAFCSYKGGTGKSLASSNFAVCLSRLGKNCALIDMDFDGPSLHMNFKEAKHAPGKGGFLDYFFSNLKKESLRACSMSAFSV